MRTVCISKAQINYNRHLILHRFLDHIIYSLHQFCCPWKSICPRTCHLDNDQLTCRCHALIFSASGCNSRNSRSMSRNIPAWNHLFPFFPALNRQCYINLRLCIFCSYRISIRRISRNRLIPKRPDPGRPVRIAEVRKRNIDPTVHNTDQNTVSIKI
ncbi:unknown [Lachnospiraceae bacterium CAG:215]|nr:unknown [Lachnospiraceae bacterium CAG:215]